MVNDNNEFHIYIHTDGASDSKSTVAGANNTESDVFFETGLEKAAAGIVSFATTASLADNLISYAISQVSLETGATEYEERLAASYSIAKSIGGAGVALIGGALTGNLAAAAVGVAFSGLSKIISIEQKRQTLATNQALEDISINMARVRAGVGGRRNANQ